VQVTASTNSGAVEAVPVKQVSSPGNLANKSLSDFNALLSLLIGGPVEDQSTQTAIGSNDSKQGTTGQDRDKRKQPGLDPNTSLALVPSPQLPAARDITPDPALSAHSKTASPVPVDPGVAALGDPLQVDSLGVTRDSQAQLDLAGARKGTPSQNDPMAFAAQLTEYAKSEKNTQQLVAGSRPGSGERIGLQGGSNTPKSTQAVPTQSNDLSGGDQSSPDNSRQFARAFGPWKEQPKGANSSSARPDGGTNPGYDGVPRPLEMTANQAAAAKDSQAAASQASEQLELKSETNQTLRPQPAREISLRLSGNETGELDLRITERAGKVQVSVRTSDENLSSSLQSNLGDLVGRLERKGFATETWTPDSRATQHIAGPETANNSSDSGNPNQPGSQSQSGDPRQSQQRNRPQWVNELDSGSPGEEEGETNG
jgi:hypothetical protein